MLWGEGPSRLEGGTRRLALSPSLLGAARLPEDSALLYKIERKIEYDARTRVAAEAFVRAAPLLPGRRSMKARLMRRIDVARHHASRLHLKRSTKLSTENCSHPRGRHFLAPFLGPFLLLRLIVRVVRGKRLPIRRWRAA